MRTPRPQTRSRGINTLIGNGWLREASRSAFPAGWHDLRSRSAMKKCMYLPIPPGVRELALPNIASALPLPPPAVKAKKKDEPPIVQRVRDPRKDARMFAAVKPEMFADKKPRAWWEDPIALGSLLILCPPVGLAAVWSSKGYSSDARWALTIMTGLMMCLVTAIAIAALALR